jgi:twitching motility protein PilT
MSPSILNQLFTACERLGASDIHLAPGQRPFFRVKGALDRGAEGDFPVMTRGVLSLVAADLLYRMSGIAQEELPSLLSRRGSVDGACTSPSGGRYRFNIFRCQSMAPEEKADVSAAEPSLGVALRLLEDRFRSLEELGLPERLSEFCGLKDGLVIVSGPTGSGKSTTLATLIDQINRTRSGHIITIEDPVEYIHTSLRSLVQQRQIGLDAAGFNEALVDSLREDPDIILVGEIRERETVRTAITAAETGHLVFTTLHAGDCVGAVERLVSVFSSGEQEAIRRQVSLVLKGIVAQRLLPSERKNAPRRRVPVCEILINTPAVANLIATGKSAQIYSAMETGGALGMQTLEQDLSRLCLAGEISQGTAFALARNSEVVRHRIHGAREAE